MPDATKSSAVSLADIELACRVFDADSDALEAEVNELNAQLDEVLRPRLSTLKRLAGRVASSKAQLHQLVDAGRDLFKKPKTVIFHGIKAGLQSSEGKIAFVDDDPDSVVSRIKKTMVASAAAKYIRTIEEPDKIAIRELDAEWMRKIGCSIEGAGDQILIKREDGEIKKMVDKLIAKKIDAIIDPENPDSA